MKRFLISLCVLLLAALPSSAQWSGSDWSGAIWNGGIWSVVSASTTTWNTSDASAGLSFSNGNLTVTETTTGNTSVRATKSYTTGKHYYESTATTSGGNQVIGLANASYSFASNFIGADTNAVGYFENGQVLINGSAVTTIATYTQGNVIGVAIDYGNAKIWFRVGAGNWNNDVIANQNPATNTGGVSISGVLASAGFAAWSGRGTSEVETANFGGSAFANAAPSGFSNY